MSIQVGLHNESSGSLDEAETIWGAQDFFYLAETLTMLMDPARDWDDEDNKEYQDAFLGFIKEARAGGGDERFAAYCNFIGDAYKAVAQEAGGAVTDLTTGQAPKAPDPGDFDADVRAMLGDLVISGRKISPEGAAELFNAMLWLGVVLQRHITHYQQEQPEVVPRLNFAMESIKSIAAYLELAIEESRPLRFEC